MRAHQASSCASSTGCAKPAPSRESEAAMTRPSPRTSGRSLYGCALRSLPERHLGGQSLVIFALLLVALAGIAGLALDGGNILMIRRQGQNAADPASPAGAFIICRFNLRGD